MISAIDDSFFFQPKISSALVELAIKDGGSPALFCKIWNGILMFKTSSHYFIISSIENPWPLPRLKE